MLGPPWSLTLHNFIIFLFVRPFVIGGDPALLLGQPVDLATLVSKRPILIWPNATMQSKYGHVCHYTNLGGPLVSSSTRRIALAGQELSTQWRFSLVCVLRFCYIYI